MSDAFRWTVLAHLMRPQGRRGELLSELLTDFPERFEQHPEVYLASPGFAGSPLEARPARVISHWQPTGRNHGRIVLGFSGTDSINDAETLCGLNVLIPTEDRKPLDDGAEYIDDLVGCTVFNSGDPVGLIEDVEFPTTSDGTRRLEDAAPLLTVRTDTGREVLIPYVQNFIVSQDTSAKQIHMRLPEGLVDLNS